MSTVVKRVYDEVKFEGIRLMFKNFAGRKDDYNQNGKRSFAIPLEEPLALELLDIGWNVKMKEKPNDEGKMEKLYHLSVTVNMDGDRAPRVFLISETPEGDIRRTKLEGDLVKLLDFADLLYVDLTISPYNYNFNGRRGVTAYLKNLFATLRPDDLERKYAHVPMLDAPLAIEAGDGILDIEGSDWEDDEDPIFVDDPKALESGTS